MFSVTIFIKTVATYGNKRLRFGCQFLKMVSNGNLETLSNPGHPPIVRLAVWSGLAFGKKNGSTLGSIHDSVAHPVCSLLVLYFEPQGLITEEVLSAALSRLLNVRDDFYRLFEGCFVPFAYLHDHPYILEGSLVCCNLNNVKL